MGVMHFWAHIKVNGTTVDYCKVWIPHSSGTSGADTEDVSPTLLVVAVKSLAVDDEVTALVDLPLLGGMVSTTGAITDAYLSAIKISEDA